MNFAFLPAILHCDILCFIRFQMSFSDFKELTGFTGSELAELAGKCFKDAQIIHGHTFYQGQNRHTYAQTTLTFRGKKYHFRKGQLSLFLKMVRDGEDMAIWDKNKGVSHLCHSKSCITPEHLVLETSEQNRERDECNNRGYCVEHGGREKCIF